MLLFAGARSLDHVAYLAGAPGIPKAKGEPLKRKRRYGLHTAWLA